MILFYLNLPSVVVTGLHPPAGSLQFLAGHKDSLLFVGGAHSLVHQSCLFHDAEEWKRLALCSEMRLSYCLSWKKSELALLLLLLLLLLSKKVALMW